MRQGTVIALMAVLGVLLGSIQPSWAFQLGELRVLSSLGEPFLAEIPVTLQPGEAVRDGGVVIGAVGDYRRAGLFRVSAVDLLQVQIQTGPDGATHARVTSLAPITAPFFNLVIKGSQGLGAQVSAFPVNLGLGTPSRGDATAGPAGNNASRISANSPVQVLPPIGALVDPVAISSAPAQPHTPSPSALSLADSYGPVSRGENLSTIADRLTKNSGLTPSQGMVAIWRENRSRFLHDNMNGLKTGAMLRIPARQVMARTDPGEAWRIRERHRKAWERLNAASREGGNRPSARETPAADRPNANRSAASPAAQQPVAAASGLESALGSEPEAESAQALREQLAQLRAQNLALANQLSELSRESARLREALTQAGDADAQEWGANGEATEVLRAQAGQLRERVVSLSQRLGQQATNTDEMVGWLRDLGLAVIAIAMVLYLGWRIRQRRETSPTQAVASEPASGGEAKSGGGSGPGRAEPSLGEEAVGAAPGSLFARGGQDGEAEAKRAAPAPSEEAFGDASEGARVRDASGEAGVADQLTPSGREALAALGSLGTAGEAESENPDGVKEGMGDGGSKGSDLDFTPIRKLAEADGQGSFGGQDGVEALTESGPGDGRNCEAPKSAALPSQNTGGVHQAADLGSLLKVPPPHDAPVRIYGEETSGQEAGAADAPSASPDANPQDSQLGELTLQVADDTEGMERGSALEPGPDPDQGNGLSVSITLSDDDGVGDSVDSGGLADGSPPGSAFQATSAPGGEPLSLESPASLERPAADGDGAERSVVPESESSPASHPGSPLQRSLERDSQGETQTTPPPEEQNRSPMAGGAFSALANALANPALAGGGAAALDSEQSDAPAHGASSRDEEPLSQSGKTFSFGDAGGEKARPATENHPAPEPREPPPTARVAESSEAMREDSRMETIAFSMQDATLSSPQEEAGSDPGDEDDEGGELDFSSLAEDFGPSGAELTPLEFGEEAAGALSPPDEETAVDHQGVAGEEKVGPFPKLTLKLADDSESPVEGNAGQDGERR